VTYLIQALIAGALTALLIVWLRRPALRFGLVDHPGGRKRHGESVPLTGGLAITVATFVALSVSFGPLHDYRVLFVAMLLLAVIGLLDDLGEVSPRSKLGVQVLAAVLMTSWGNHFLLSLGDILARGPISLNNWAIPLTVFATVAVINAVNMFDGVDGLAGGLVLVILAFFAYFAWSAGDVNALKLLVVLIGAIAGFLLFNAPLPWRGDRRVFMGDTGSLVLGFVVVWFSIDFTQRADNAVPPVVMLWIVGVLLLDVFTVTARRILRRRDPAAPDRAHIHHLLLRRGYSATKTMLILLAANAGLGAIGVLGWRNGVSEATLFFVFFALGLVYLTVFLYPGRWLYGRRRVANGGSRSPTIASDEKTPPPPG